MLRFMYYYSYPRKNILQNALRIAHSRLCSTILEVYAQSPSNPLEIKELNTYSLSVPYLPISTHCLSSKMFRVWNIFFLMEQEVQVHTATWEVQVRKAQVKFKYQLPSCLWLVVRWKHADKGDQNPVGGREEEELLKGCHMPPQEEKVCNIFNVQQWLLPYECRWRHNL